MYTDRKRKLPGWLIPAAILVALACVLAVFALGGSGRDMSREGATAIREAIERGALQCYAVEGVYPPNLQYLEENYGLQVNTEDYYVTYEAFASNLAPTVIVQSKR